MSLTDLPSVRELSDEELNVIVAECCIQGLTGPYGCYSSPQLSGRVNGEEWVIPNYSQSLDAMALAEAAIVDLLEISNYEYLVRTAISNDLEEYVHPLQLRDMRLIQCTARQRSEAFAICRGVAKP